MPFARMNRHDQFAAVFESAFSAITIPYHRQLSCDDQY